MRPRSDPTDVSRALGAIAFLQALQLAVIVAGFLYLLTSG